MKTIEEAVRELWENYVKPPAKDSNVQSVGIGNNIIYINTKKTTKGYPKEYEGFPVVVRRVGQVKLEDK
jgi:hypothetical protein